MVIIYYFIYVVTCSIHSTQASKEEWLWILTNSCTAVSSYFPCLCHSCSIQFSYENISCAHRKWYFVSLCIILQRQTAGYNVVVHGCPNKKVSSLKCEPFANQTSFLNRQLDGIAIHCLPSKACCTIILPEYILGHLLINSCPVSWHPGLYIHNKTWQFVVVFVSDISSNPDIHYFVLWFPPLISFRGDVRFSGLFRLSEFEACLARI